MFQRPAFRCAVQLVPGQDNRTVAWCVGITPFVTCRLDPSITQEKMEQSKCLIFHPHNEPAKLAAECSPGQAQRNEVERSAALGSVRIDQIKGNVTQGSARYAHSTLGYTLPPASLAR